MPFIDIRLAGRATRDQKAAIVADVTRSMVERLGKPAAAVQVNILELAPENYGAAGRLVDERAPVPAAEPVPLPVPPVQEVASANGQR